MFKIQKKQTNKLSVFSSLIFNSKVMSLHEYQFLFTLSLIQPFLPTLSFKNKITSWEKIRESFYSLSEEMATHSNILAWKIPWIEEPGGSQRVGHDSATLICFAIRNRFLHRLSCGYQSIRLKLFRTFLLIPLKSSHIPPLPRTYS